jgi:hypothetical protein
MVNFTSVIVTEKNTTYATEDEFRQFTGLTDPTEFPSSDVLSKLQLAAEKLKKDAFQAIRLEFVTKDSNNRYFVQRRWLANAWGTDSACGVVTPMDLRVWESDETSSVSSAFFLQGSRINRLIHQIPVEGIQEWDSINGYFKLTSAWPSNSSYRIFVDYWICGKPLNEIQQELMLANIYWAEILLLEEKKPIRLKNGVVSLNQGERTVTRSEEEFDKMIRDLYNSYHSVVNLIRPFFGRKFGLGKFAESRTEWISQNAVGPIRW